MYSRLSQLHTHVCFWCTHSSLHTTLKYSSRRTCLAWFLAGPSDDAVDHFLLQVAAFTASSLGPARNQARHVCLELYSNVVWNDRWGCSTPDTVWRCICFSTPVSFHVHLDYDSMTWTDCTQSHIHYIISNTNYHNDHLPSIHTKYIIVKFVHSAHVHHDIYVDDDCHHNHHTRAYICY